MSKFTKQLDLLRRIRRHAAKRNDIFILTPEEVRTINEWLQSVELVEEESKSTKDIPSPGMAHASIHAPWMLEKMEDVEIKTIGELLDQLMIENLKIWHLVDKAEQGDETVQKDIQDHNATRRKIVRALDRRLGERDIGGRV